MYFVPSLVVVLLAILMSARRDRKGDITRFFLAVIFSSAILGSGSAIQDIFQEMLLPGNINRGMVYNIEFHTSEYFDAVIKSVIISGLELGPILAILLLKTRSGKSSKNSAITATVVLISGDLYNIILGDFNLIRTFGLKVTSYINL
jgi:hypothetical protein